MQQASCDLVSAVQLATGELNDPLCLRCCCGDTTGPTASDYSGRRLLKTYCELSDATLDTLDGTRMLRSPVPTASCCLLIQIRL